MVTVILRKAYGGAYTSMMRSEVDWRPDSGVRLAGRSDRGHGAEGAASIMYRRRLRRPRDGTFDETKAALVARYEDENVNPEVSVASGQLDGIIAPADTRQTIIDSLHLLASKDQRAPM